MKRMLFVAALMAALPWGASAQVEKRVEVTKAYVPSVEGASKLAVVPDMTDTVKMRPEIDYTITPLSLQTTLATRPIRPATVTYWEFNRPLPFYLKAGMGYPFNSVLDFYASSQNPGTGYVVGYVNHEGRYSKIGNDFGVKNNSTRMFNRIGAAAGKYFGALFCVIGHMFPVFYGFKGGKGILCSGTLLLLLDWRIALVGWGAFVVLWLTTRYVSLGSVAAAVSLPFTTYFVFHNTACTVLGTCISLLVLWAHRSNIKRLLSGTESKFHFHVNAPKPGEDE